MGAGRRRRAAITARTTIAVASAIAAMAAVAGCAADPAPRQASRATTPEAAAAVARLGWEPPTIEIVAADIRDEVRVTGRVEAITSVALLPEYPTSFVEPPLPVGSVVAAGDVVAVVRPTEDASATATEPLPEVTELVSPIDGIVVGSRRVPAVADPADLAIVLAPSALLPAGIASRSAVTFVRADDVGGTETGTLVLPAAGDEPGSDDGGGGDGGDDDGTGDDAAAPVVITSDAVAGAGASVPYGADVVVTLTGPVVPDALVVPATAVRSQRDSTFLVVIDLDGSRRRVDVTIGAREGDRVQVVGDVRAGQTVVLP